MAAWALPEGVWLLPNVILVGAQAVYLHTGAGELAQPPMTTDADLALDTSALADVPEIASGIEGLL